MVSNEQRTDYTCCYRKIGYVLYLLLITCVYPVTRVEASPTAGPAEVPETELQLPETPGSVFVDSPGPMAEQGLEGHTGKWVCLLW